MSLKKVLVFGGTHGNEWTGIYAVQKYEEYLRNKFPELDLKFILSNPEAFKVNKRFKDEDLNRAFQFLNEKRSTYEHQRAHEIKKMIDADECFVIDLHTTTSNMGNTVIVSHENALNLFVSSELAKKCQKTRVILSPDPERKYLASQSNFGLMIEVGPVPNGVINPIVLESTLDILEQTLEAISTLPQDLSGSLEVYEEIEDIYYPQNEKQEITAYIHPIFQDRDFKKLQGEYTPFRTFSGEEIKMNAKEKLYPIFINEAAYYPTKLAFTLCKKRELSF